MSNFCEHHHRKNEQVRKNEIHEHHRKNCWDLNSKNNGGYITKIRYMDTVTKSGGCRSLGTLSGGLHNIYIFHCSYIKKVCIIKI